MIFVKRYISAIIAAASLFSCCFFTVFTIKNQLTELSVDSWEIMLLQAFFALICFIFDTKILIGIGLAPLLYFKQDIQSATIGIQHLPILFGSCGLIILMLSKVNWMRWIISFMGHKPDLVTASSFCALLSLETTRIAVTCDQSTLIISAIGVSVLVIAHLYHNYFAPVLVFIAICIINSEPATASFHLALPDMTGMTFSASLIKDFGIAITHLLIILGIDISTCIHTISRPLKLDMNNLPAIRKTLGTNSLIAGFLGIGLSIIYFENLVIAKNQQERRAVPLFAGICFAGMGIILAFITIDITQMVLIFSTYLIFLIFEAIILQHGLSGLWKYLIAILILYGLHGSYIQTLGTLSILGHLSGYLYNDIQWPQLKKNLGFWSVIIIYTFIF